VFPGNTYLSYFFHQLLRRRVHTGFYQLFPNKGCSQEIGVHKVNIVIPVIAEYIYYQLISGEIMCLLVLCADMMHILYQPGFAAVIIYNAIADMSYRADGKKELNVGIDGYDLIEAIT